MSHFQRQDLALEFLREDQDRRAAARDERRFVRQARERLGTICREA